MQYTICGHHSTAFKVDEQGGGHSRYKGIAFPTGASCQKFESALSKQSKELPVDVIDFLSRTAAYPGGKGALLFALHDMNIDDKHHPFLTPISLGMRAGQMGPTASFFFGPVFTIGSRRGQHLVRDPIRGALVQSDPERRMRYRAGPIVDLTGGRLEFRSGAYDDFEFATTSEEAILLHEFRPLLNIAFNQVQGLEGVPVVSALCQMHQLVEDILLTFEKRFLS